MKTKVITIQNSSLPNCHTTPLFSVLLRLLPFTITVWQTPHSDAPRTPYWMMSQQKLKTGCGGSAYTPGNRQT